MPSFKEQLSAAPQALDLVGRFLRLLGKSDDPMVFLVACRDGNFSRAFDTIDQPNEQIHEEITAIREKALSLSEDHPELVENDPDGSRS